MIEQSLTILRRNKQIAPLIKKYGKPELVRGKNPFQALVRSIIYQQLSGKAAATIFARFVALFPQGAFPTPKMVSNMPDATLRSAGLSGQKVTYIKDLAQKFSDGTINSHTLSRMKSSELIQHLVQVKGIGEWTVHMFLIFTLNRVDVLPTGDLGIRKGTDSGTAKTIVKRTNTALAASDILANKYCILIYDGTNLVLINPVVN